MKKLSLSLSALLLGLFVIANNIFADSNPANSKPKVIFVYQEHCRMCHEFENTVLSDPKVKEELKKFNFTKIDANSGKVDVEVTPTIIIYNKNNKQIKKYVPNTNKDKFLQILKKAE